MNVKAKKMLSLVLAFVMVLGMLPATVFATNEAGRFVDVPAGAWFSDAVQYVADNGLMVGVDDNHFAPGGLTTRCMVVKVLHRMEGEPSAEGTGFTDVEDGVWYTEAILWAQENGIVEGYGDGTFHPHASMTREEMMAVIYRYSQYKGYDVSEAASLTVFTDSVKIQSYAEDAMAWAVSVGLIVGFEDGTIRPQADSNRAQLATVLMRYSTEKDDDHDGIPNIIEDVFDLSEENDDTDSDGIIDYTEIYEIGSDPTVFDSDEDMDNDGLSNYDEVLVHGTNATKADSDLDNLIDYDEIYSYGTNPLVYDSDEDGVSDGYEIELGTDPMVANEKFQVSKDYQAEDDGASASVDIELSGNQVETLEVKPVNNNALFSDDMPGCLGEAYDFSVEGNFDNAVISFEFDPSILENGADPAIFYFNEAEQTLEELETTINGNVASAVVNHFSVYVLIDRNIYYEFFTWEDVWDTEGTYYGIEIVLVIDDSGSMDWNDSKNERLQVAKNLIDKLPENSKIGVVSFEDNTGILTSTLTTDRELAKSYLTTSYFIASGGTYMYTAINDAFALFESQDETILKMMVVLSDGDAHDSTLHAATINAANNNNVRIYTVGLGSSTTYFTDYLKPLAESTGGAFYLASNADGLASIYDDISKRIDLEADADGDGIPDYYEEHMISFDGMNINLDKNDADTDNDGLTDGEEVKVELVYNEDKSQVYVKGKILTDPSLVDTDFDGISDYYDNAPKSNYFAGELGTEQAESHVGYSFDYRWFFDNNKNYNKSLARTSLLFSSFIYAGGGYTYDKPVCYKELNNTLVGSANIRSLMEVHGFEDIIIYDLDNEYQNGNTNSMVTQVGYTDDDVTEVAIGHHNVCYNGETKEVVMVVVRGTNGTIEEWASNFDLGDPNNRDDAWNNPDNHRGFDVTTSRVYKLLEKYESSYLSDKNSTYWVMGHSRGAAIANILSAMLIDNGESVFGYTFAAPNTTIAEDANSAKYDSIFNLVNEDDFVPCVPMSAWNFVRYGRTATLDMTSDRENEWHDLTDKFWYNQLSEKSLNELVGALANASTGSADQKWANCFVYTCDCEDHGNSSCDDITEKGINDIYDIPSRVRKYCEYSPYTNWYGGTEYEVCQLPAYFMQALADIITTSGTWDKAWKVVSTYQFADRYQDARTKIVLASTVGGINCPHYCETYYLLTGYAVEGDFR